MSTSQPLPVDSSPVPEPAPAESDQPHLTPYTIAAAITFVAGTLINVQFVSEPVRQVCSLIVMIVPGLAVIVFGKQLPAVRAGAQAIRSTLHR